MRREEEGTEEAGKRKEKNGGEKEGDTGLGHAS
jgi:hypothetical protein